MEEIENWLAVIRLFTSSREIVDWKGKHEEIDYHIPVSKYYFIYEIRWQCTPIPCTPIPFIKYDVKSLSIDRDSYYIFKSLFANLYKKDKIKRIGKPYKICIKQTTKHNPINEEFEQLYQSKLKIHSGTKDDFINSEIDQIDNKMIFPDFVIKEYKIINQWKKFLVEKTKPAEPAPKANPEKPNQLQTELTAPQRGKLFDLLLSNKYIAPLTDKESFIWAFGCEQKQPIHWQPINWIDKSITRKEPNIQTLYELLYLLKIDKDTSANNPNNLYRKMEFCFYGLVNIAAKNPTKIQQKTDRQKLLKTIIEEVEKVEAQK